MKSSRLRYKIDGEMTIQEILEKHRNKERQSQENRDVETEKNEPLRIELMKLGKCEQNTKPKGTNEDLG